MHRILLLLAALLFSTGGAAVKAISLTPWQIACFRSGIAAIVLFIALREGRRGWSPRVILVGATYALTMILYVTCNKLTTAANTIFLQGAAPLYLLLLGPWLLRESIRRRDVIFTAVMALGMALFFVGSEPPQETAPNPMLGNVLAAVSGLTWALTILGLRWLGRGVGGNASSAGAAVVVGNLIAFAVCLTPALPVASSVASDWLIISYLGLFQIGLAYVFLTRGVRRVPALEASLLLLLEPVLSVVWAWWIHGEVPGPWSMTGCGMILVATVGRTLRSVIKR